MSNKIKTKYDKYFIEEKDIPLEILENEKCSLFLNFENEEKTNEFLLKFNNRFPNTPIITSSIIEGKEEFYIDSIDNESNEEKKLLRELYWQSFVDETQFIINIPQLKNDGSLAKLDVILKEKMGNIGLFGGCRIVFINTDAEEYVKSYSEFAVR